MPLLSKDAAARLYQKGLALQKQGRINAARDYYKQVLAAFPNQTETHFRLAEICLADWDIERGLTHIQTALAAQPNTAVLWSVAARLHAAADDTDQALHAYDRQIALHPKQIKPRADKALYLQRLGRFEEANKLLTKLLRQLPNDGELYRMMTAGQTLPKGTPLIRAMQKALAAPTQTDLGKMHLGFALAKAMEDTGQHDKVFKYLNLANHLQRQMFPSALPQQEAERLAALTAQKPLPNPPSIQRSDGPAPVLVTGLPRSGTTLVEQIIASHSQVTAGGELGLARQAAFDLFQTPQGFVPLDQVAQGDLSRFEQTYRTYLRRIAKGSVSCVTDKSIRSELIFGYIQAAMPDARFIVVHRDPRDIALSIYKNYFEGGSHRYSNDLADIAATIHAFRQSIAFWKAARPGMVFEVHYEDLVSDPEPQARAVIEAAGLAWEDQCLAFHKSKSAVKTLSLAQVRQPIHTGRTMAWQRYAQDLKPFTDAWEALTT